MKKMKTSRNLLLAILLLIAYDISAQSAGPWKIKETAVGEFLIRDHGGGYNVFTIEPQTMNDAIYIGNNGVVGFGTTTPAVLNGNKIDVKGDISCEDNNAWVEVNNSLVGSNAGINFLEDGIYKGWVFYNGSYDFLTLSCDASGYGYMLNIHSSGDVTIGNTTPAAGYKLTVEGKVACREVMVQASGSWPDYVFNEEYELMNLKQLEESIEKNNHLPGIPSTAEIEEKGFSLGEMQRIFLEKIEELTLYTIEQGKQIEELQRTIEALKKENK